MAFAMEINSEAGVPLRSFNQIVATVLTVRPQSSASAARAAIAIRSIAATRTATCSGSTYTGAPIHRVDGLSALRGIVLPRKERDGPKRSALVLSTKRRSNCLANARTSASKITCSEVF